MRNASKQSESAFFDVYALAKTRPKDEECEIHNRLLARFAALDEQLEIAEEQAKKAANVATQQVATERAYLDAKAELLRQQIVDEVSDAETE